MNAPRELRPLSRALREAREESIPELDWGKLEARLRALEPAPRAQPTRSVKASVALAAAALSAAAALAMTLSGDPPAKSGAAVSEPAVVNGSETTPDRQTLDASNGSLTLARPGRASLTLAQGGHAELRDRDGVLTLYLERGKVTAGVEPSAQKESFAVEAAGVRVAVHGTKFSVELGADSVSVVVTEGVVLVGPSAAPGTGKLLSAGKSEKFTLKGEPLARREKTHPSDRSPPTLNAPIESAEPIVEEPPVEEPRVLAARSIAEVESAVSGLLGAANRCFRERSTDGLHVTAQTAATFKLSADGRVTDLAFEPPLSPSVQSCIASSASTLAVGEATGELVVTRRLELSR